MHYRFGEFSLHPDAFVLRRGDRPIPLQPRAFRVLSCLIAERHRVVTRAELIAHCWDGRVVADAALNTAVRAIRRALGEDGHDRGTIRTHHKRGYRFTADVRIINTPVVPGGGEAAPQTDEREYKHVGVLCCVVTGAVQLAARLGAEDMDALMRTVLAAADEIVARYDGTVLSHAEDGFTAVFGAPMAHEDPVRRGVLAALELARRVSETVSARTAGFAGPAMGLHCGPVLVGLLPGTGGQPYVAAGRTTAMARALQQAAQAGELLISEAAWRTVSAEVHAECTRAGDLPAWRVSGVVAERAGVPKSAAGPAAPFLGRERELALLHERLGMARDGQGQIIIVSGEPGIGKSCLLREFRRHLAGVDWYQGHCLPYAGNAPLFPVLELVRRLCGARVEDPPATVASRLAEVLEQAGCRGPENVALVMQLLDLDVTPDSLVRLSPQLRRERALSLLYDLVLFGPRRQPHVLVIEDLHWADAWSRRWLKGLAGRIAGARALLVLTCRTGHEGDWPQVAPRTRMELPPLTRQATRELIDALAQGLAAGVAIDIAERAAGNPFFVEELTRAMAGGGKPGTIPETVQGVLAARIDRLPPAGKRLLQTAAVIGTRIPVTLWSAVAGGTEKQMHAALDQLQSEGFVLELRAAPLRTCAFKHALTREVAYRSLSSGMREDLHARTARLIEQELPDSVLAQPEVLAHHYTRAGDHGAAVRCWQQGARRAYERSAISESIQYVRMGLSLLEQLPAGHTRDRAELELLMALGPALMAARGYADGEVGRVWQRARELCGVFSDGTGLFKACIGSWNFHWVRGELSQAVTRAGELLKLARTGGSPVRLMRAHAAMGETLLHAGRLVEARRHLDRGVGHFSALDRHTHATDAPGIACLCYAGWVRWHLGRPDPAPDPAEQALTLARRLGHPFSLAVALCLGAELHQFRMHAGPTLELSEEAIALCRDQGFPFWEGTARVLNGWATAQLGGAREGVAIARQGLAIFCATGARVQLSSWYGLLAEACLLAGEVPAGHDALDRAFHWAAETGEKYHTPENHRLRAGLLHSEGRMEQAEASLGLALSAARAQRSRPREWRATLDLARLLFETGRPAEARDLLTPLCSTPVAGITGGEIAAARHLLLGLH